MTARRRGAEAGAIANRAATQLVAWPEPSASAGRECATACNARDTRAQRVWEGCERAGSRAAKAGRGGCRQQVSSRGWARESERPVRVPPRTTAAPPIGPEQLHERCHLTPVAKVPRAVSLWPRQRDGIQPRIDGLLLVVIRQARDGRGHGGALGCAQWGEAESFCSTLRPAEGRRHQVRARVRSRDRWRARRTRPP